MVSMHVIDATERWVAHMSERTGYPNRRAVSTAAAIDSSSSEPGTTGT